MKIKQRKWNYESLDKILTDYQLRLLEVWLQVNQLDDSDMEYIDDMEHGITVYAKQPSSQEFWAIDFTRIKEEK